MGSPLSGFSDSVGNACPWLFPVSVLTPPLAPFPGRHSWDLGAGLGSCVVSSSRKWPGEWGAQTSPTLTSSLGGAGRNSE